MSGLHRKRATMMSMGLEIFKDTQAPRVYREKILGGAYFNEWDGRRQS